MQTPVGKRNRLQILTEIVHVCESPLAKTHIMRKVNLCHGTVRDCLQLLQELNLVELSRGTAGYVATERGMSFLAKWDQLQDFLTRKASCSLKGYVFEQEVMH